MGDEIASLPGQPMPAGRPIGDSGAPTLVRQPGPGERLEVEIASLPAAIEFTGDLSNATADLIDGKLQVTFPDGGVLILYGAAVAQFLAAYGETLPAAGQPDAGDAPDDGTTPACAACGKPGTIRRAPPPARPPAPCRKRRIAAPPGDAGTTGFAATYTPQPPPLSARLPASAVAHNDFYDRRRRPRAHRRRPGALANDGDGDAIPSAPYSSAPAHGTLTLNGDGSFTYSPHANYAGADSFSYAVPDGRGGTSIATVTLSVLAVADAPMLAVAAAGGGEDTAIALRTPALADLDGSESLSLEIGAIPPARP